MTLAELKQKYPTMFSLKYEPDPNCRLCRGTGERKLRDGDRLYPCICAAVRKAAEDDESA